MLRKRKPAIESAPASLNGPSRFLDVAGSTAFKIARSDTPDQWILWVQQCSELLAKAVERCNGRVVKFIADEVMETFENPSSGRGDFERRLRSKNAEIEEDYGRALIEQHHAAGQQSDHQGDHRRSGCGGCRSRRGYGRSGGTRGRRGGRRRCGVDADRLAKSGPEKTTHPVLTSSPEQDRRSIDRQVAPLRPQLRSQSS